MSVGVSIRELALRAIVAALGSQGSPAANVYRSKLDQITQANLPCYDVTPGEIKLMEMERLAVECTLPVTVRAIVDAAAAEGDVPGGQLSSVDDSALDPFYVFAVRQLVGGGGNLGGLVIGVEEMDGTTVYQPNGKDLIGLEMVFDVKFAVKRGDPTQKG